MPVESPKMSIVREYCAKWPTHSNYTLARAIYKKYPELWRDVETIRVAVRRVRGAAGDKDRKHYKNKTQFRPLLTPNYRTPLPTAVQEKWITHTLEGSKILVLSDTHIPYHDPVAIELALQSGEDAEVDTILLNGDIGDFFGQSRWKRDPRDINVEREINALRQFLKHLRERFPGTSIIWRFGNHEERWEHWLWEKAPELLGVEAFDFNAIYGLPELNIQVLKDKCLVMAGKLHILHGHEYPKGITNPVNQARGMFLRGGESALAGHGHRSSYHPDTSLAGRLTACWSTGCLCQLHPDYAVINKWDQGFAIVTVEENGDYHVQNRQIYQGKVY